MNFFDAVVECVDYVNTAEFDPQVEKQDLVDSIRARLSIMISRIMSASSHCEPHSIVGWTIDYDPLDS